MGVIAYSRAVGPVLLDVILTESHGSEIEITGNPIETGAEVNDHAYILPKTLTLEFADNGPAETWAALVRFQESRVPFQIVTGLSVYKNMLIKSIVADRDATFSNTLRGSVELQEVIIVETAYAASSGAEEHPEAGNTAKRSARPSPGKSGDAATARRASGTVQRGDSPVKNVPIPTARPIVQGTFAP